jgi:hypothetical protein
VPRSPLQAPDMGQHNAPRPVQAPDLGRHNAAPQAVVRPPLQAPDMGQHNAPPPMHAAVQPPDGAPANEQNTPSGLPSRAGTGPARLTPPDAPGALHDPSTAPSGLPGRRPQ